MSSGNVHAGGISWYRKFRYPSSVGPENVLEVHNCDMVNDPRNTISNLFDFMDVKLTSEHFLDICSEKIFKSTSRTRDLIEWRPEQVSRIEQEMKKYKMLSRYNFTSD